MSFFGQTGRNNAINLFGVDSGYIVNVKEKEILNLVEIGFSYECLQTMPIMLRRYYFQTYIKKHEKNILTNNPLDPINKDRMKNMTMPERMAYEKQNKR